MRARVWSLLLLGVDCAGDPELGPVSAIEGENNMTQEDARVLDADVKRTRLDIIYDDEKFAVKVYSE
jgi:hypothetical protein